MSSPTQTSKYEYMLSFTCDGFHRHASGFIFREQNDEVLLDHDFGTQESCYLGSMILNTASLYVFSTYNYLFLISV
ncbi:hypothetical protein IMY05_C2265000100 [Salix suchowensis]|nr:hypothetical protein IMY05_C2265000100 [Salix suchowensis]